MTESSLHTIVVGLGVQGHKRRAAAGGDFVLSVDPVNPEADLKTLAEVPLDRYDAALVCVPDEPKVELLEYLLSHGKHVLVEKPLWAAEDAAIARMQALARHHGAYCRTAYNHRFEPHFVRMRDVIASGVLGRIYRCRMFYGNGTARLVRDSVWRDKGAGVLPDLGSHLLDTLRFWFGPVGEGFRLVASHRFENRAPDHVVIGCEASGNDNGPISLELEMTLLSWRNHFTCDVFAEKGSAHISSLCKWGPSTFTLRGRVLPSGRPPEEEVTLVEDDPTWAAEYQAFKAAVAAGTRTDLDDDLWLNRLLRWLGEEALASATHA